MWARFCKTWVPGFEKLLDEGIKRQWYNIINITDRCITIVIDTCLRIYGLHRPEIGSYFVGWPFLSGTHYFMGSETQ